ncbi:DNA topoisomerase IV subunit A [Tenuibacillus multivorans]|uniref:DNA topoisomerase 4 subunit A n=1 Tax=Tenuibacillus multivorans TaxID=237069 RepID=A0A1H0CJ55_9BACI|nr:DNA topoisomerase IV subunit A [Tenuibacillus multivorans]GEL76275.1 DNA topoisomerase 4 subunit A [Tenuibacillus multivorans]SDN57904.1 topoisomerase-4 subunit A [Tenuibacillus multivorans]
MAEQAKYLDLPLEEVIGDRFGRYSKYIIQDRALPDARDGLKPVQRRILYAMHQERNTHDKPFRKSAKTVGTVIGNYHPHGDSSVYEALVRMSQTWKVRQELVEMHGNNGSIDGDPPAAMRYTEARLSGIASELLRDIEKDTLEFIPNFDDTDFEAVVLPAKFPNLLVNGSTGISSGYATDIPPHNLSEVIDTIIKRIEKPTSDIDELMKTLPGPDFPTGGIIQGADGIKKAYESGRGKIVIRGLAEIEPIRGGKEQIVITELPFEVNKANLVKKMDELRIERKVEGISEVRDETDRTGLRIVIELKKDADSTGVLNYLYKNTDLQISYNFNMVAIANKTPQLMNLTQMLDAYIEHQRDVVERQTKFDLKKAKDRAHIVKGLIYAISILDDLIATIRSSNDKKHAKEQLMEKYDFSEKQAEAIVTLQLYRLTNTDITELEKEAEELKKSIDELSAILDDEKKLLQVIKKDLKKVKKTYQTERRTQIQSEIEDIKINLEVMVPSEDVVVSVTKEGYVKRTSIRSYSASNIDDLQKKDDDRLLHLMEINTTDTLLLFTNKGQYLFLPVHELPDIKWKDMGQHIANIIPVDRDEKIIKAMPVRDFNEENYVLSITKNGMIKKSELKSYQVQRYSKPMTAIKLKNDDEVVNVHLTNGHQDIFLASDTGYGLWFHEDELKSVGIKTAGVISMKLKDGEHVVNGEVFDDMQSPSLFVVTQRGACKRMSISEFEQNSRAKRGLIMLRELKRSPHRIVGFHLVNDDASILLETEQGTIKQVLPLEFRESDRYSNGSFVIDTDEKGEVIQTQVEPIYQKHFEEIDS